MATFRYHILTLVVFLSGISFAQKSMDAGYYHTVFLCSDSTVWVSGTNFSDELGIDTNFLAAPSKIEGLENIISIAVGGNHTLALNDEGQVFTWGSNQNSQLGDSSVLSSLIPILLPLDNIISIATGESFSFAIRNDGSVYVWGKNNGGQLGLGHTQQVNIPQLAVNWGQIKSIAGGQNHTVAIRNDGTVWTSGINNQYQLGDGTTLPSSTPIEVQGITNANQAAAGFYHSAVIDNAGLVWSWGYNEFGSLGDGTNLTSPSPIPAGGINNAVAIDAGQHHTVVLNNNGDVQAWGINYYGQIGNGTFSDQNTPILITTGSEHIYAGIYHSGNANSSSIQSWGLNSNYQAGNNSAMNNSSPTGTNLGCAVEKFDMACFTEAVFTASTTNICEGDEITLVNNSQNAFDYNWKIDGVSQFQGQDFTTIFNVPGTYEVQLVANPNGCSDTSSVFITVDELPSATIYTQGDLCEEQDSVELIVIGSPGNWSGIGVSGSNFDPSIAGQGTHELVYSMNNGACSNVDTLIVQVAADPVAIFNFSASGDTALFTNTSVGATNYEWYFGDGATSTEEEPLHVYNEGAYNVVLIASNDCGTEAYQQTIVFGTTGIDNNKESSIRIYPNPTSDWVFIEATSEYNQYRVLDVLGKTVAQGQISSSTTKLELTSLARGQYSILLEGNETVNESLIIK